MRYISDISYWHPSDRQGRHEIKRRRLTDGKTPMWMSYNHRWKEIWIPLELLDEVKAARQSTFVVSKSRESTGPSFVSRRAFTVIFEELPSDIRARCYVPLRRNRIAA